MKKTNHIRNTVCFMVIILLIASSGLYAFLYVSRGTLIDKALASRKIIKAAEASRQQSSEIMRLYADTSESRKGLTGFFVPAESGVAVIQALEVIGASSGADVTISAIRSAAPDPDSDTKTGNISASVTASGSWNDIMKAFELVETLPYKHNVSQANLTYGGQANEKAIRRWQISFDITVTTI